MTRFNIITLFILFFIFFPLSVSAGTVSNVAYEKNVSITGFVGGWDIPPSNTANIVDNDFNTASTTAHSLAILGNDDLNYIQIDLGNVYNVSSIHFKAYLLDSTFDYIVNSRLKISSDGITWDTLQTYNTPYPQYSLAINDTFASNISNVRYIRSCVYSDGYDIAEITLYEIQAWVPNPPPFISIINNSKTEDDSTSKIFLNNSESITFFADADQTITTWNWSVDHVLQSNNSDNLTTSWNNNGKYHYVALNATNINGTSNTLTWGVNVYPAMATATIGALNETPANEIKAALENKDAPALVMATVLPFTNLIGAFFYAIIWFIVFVMLWIKQKSMNIPMVIGIIFGGLIISFLPEQYQLVATALIVFGIFAVIYIFFKGRG